MDATRKFWGTDRCFARSAKLRICPAEGCKTKLNTMNSVVCSECKTKAQLQGTQPREFLTRGMLCPANYGDML